ncbi:MAG: ABC transporter ATP-binding protein [Longimicrobiales bacterium]|nr:ABC transporter ATP-binding protein [Longimicrobiales bacterium]
MTFVDPHFRRALTYVRPYLGALVPVVVLALASTLLTLALPYLSKVLIDDAIGGQDFPLLLRISVLFFAITLLSFGFNVFSGMRYTRVSAAILFDMRLDLYRHLQKLSPRFYARTPLGDIVSRINGDIGEIQRVITEAALSWFGQVVAFVGTVAMLVYLDWQLFLVGLLVMPPSLLALVRYRRGLEDRVRVLRERSANIGSFLIETLQGMRTVVGSNAQPREINRFRGRNDSFVEALLSMRLFTYIWGGLPGLMLTAGTSAVFVYGGYRVINGATTLGTFVAFMAYQSRLMTPVQGLMGIYTNLATARASLVRVHELLEATPDVAETEASTRLTECRGSLTLEEVSYGFGRGTEGLVGVNLEIPAGQIVAIVGSSGSGKSTLADLFSRQLDPNQGRVLLDEEDLTTLALADVRRHVAVVEQDPFLFHVSVADNVGYARPDATRAEVTEAIDAAGLGNLVRTMPEGADTVVGERGRQFSAGERQRLAIARAFLSNPSVLVLDEATGALDPSSEAAVLEGYRRVMRGRTTVIITHRLDLARQSERVIVLKDGQVVEDGPPGVLEAEGQAFRDLFLDVLAG